MAIKRFSAINIFGVPIEKPEDMADMASIAHLMDAYGVEGQAIPEALTDITPYYLQRPAYRYFISRNSPLAPVDVDLMPLDEHSTAATPLLFKGRSDMVFAQVSIRRISVPIDQEMMAIAGPSPRYIGKICFHEVIMDI